jgi:hypothetical protein
VRTQEVSRESRGRYGEEMWKMLATTNVPINMCVLVSGGLLVAGGVIFSSVQQSKEDNLSVAIIFGSLVGMVSCMAVIFAYNRYPSMRRYPAPLLYCKTWADLGFSARLFFVEGIVRVRWARSGPEWAQSSSQR